MHHLESENAQIIILSAQYSTKFNFNADIEINLLNQTNVR